MNDRRLQYYSLYGNKRYNWIQVIGGGRYLAVQLELALRRAADHTHALAGAVKLQNVENLILPLAHLPAFALPHKHGGVGALVEEEAKHLAGSHQGSFIW